MKVNFNRAALAEALNLLISVVPGRTPKPILRCLKIVAGDKDVQMCATDMEAGINYTVSEVQIETPGEVVIPADKLTAIVRESIDEVLCLTAEEGTCKITGSDSRFTIYGHDAGQYPAVPCFEGDSDMEISLLNLQSGIERCLFATAKESTRYALNGVLWEIKGKKLVLVATDGRRLVRTKLSVIKADKSLEKAKMIVPAKTMTLMDKIGSSDNEVVKIKLMDNQILISCGDVVISSNLVDGNFPKYEDIIPSGYDKKLTLKTDNMLSAVKRASLLTSEESRGIKLALNKNSMILSGRAPETGDAKIDMQVEYDGDPIEIGFNPQFFIDVLRVIGDEEFDLELGDSDRPGLVKCGTNFLCVLMPINLG